MPTREIWPDDGDARQVALATRIALFDAWRPRPSELPSPEHEQLVKSILRSTDPESVEGRGFRDFLAVAKGELAQDLRPHLGAGSASSRAVAAVRRARPVDVTEDMYKQLRALTASAYGQPDIDRLPLERSIVDTRSRSEHVTGAVPASRSRVMLAFDPDFDFRSFTRLPWVLAHELVCHAAGGQTGRYERGDDRSARQYFDEGFMSCSAATLLLTWRDLPGNDVLASADHLSIDEVQRHHSNPGALEVGREAWTGCRVAVGLPEAAVDATLALNAHAGDVKEKDGFVAMAGRADDCAIAAFVDLARGTGDAEEVLACTR